jgi:hypothetical protein
MNRRSLLESILFAVIALVAHSSPAWAERTVKESGRVVYHIPKVEVMEVPDVPGHIIAIADQRGLVTLDTGETGLWMTRVTLDLTKGNGPHHAYTVTTFEDKSTTITEGKGMTTAHPDGTSTFEGTFTYVGGTGRFAGVRGGGTYAGKRMGQLVPGVSVDLWQNYTATYKLPSP